jgi:hypothetical protein
MEMILDFFAEHGGPALEEASVAAPSG